MIIWYVLMLNSCCGFCQRLREASRERLAARVMRAIKHQGTSPDMLPDEERPLAGLGAESAMAWLAPRTSRRA